MVPFSAGPTPRWRISAAICHDGKMPGVLCVVFLPLAVGEVGLPSDQLLLVDFQAEGHLTVQSVLFFHDVTSDVHWMGLLP